MKQTCMTSLKDRKNLDREFFARDTLEVARDLIGQYVVRNMDGYLLAGRIVEVEAYIGEDDPACHARFGPTNRNRVMYGPGGFSYVYFIYGMYNMLNIVSDREGFPAAVLIRALEPIEGMAKMKELRDSSQIENLTSGPGKLCAALDIDTSLSAIDMTVPGDLYVAEGAGKPFKIASTSRIGIREGLDREWRFIEEGNPYVSR